MAAPLWFPGMQNSKFQCALEGFFLLFSYVVTTPAFGTVVARELSESVWMVTGVSFRFAHDPQLE